MMSIENINSIYAKTFNGVKGEKVLFKGYFYLNHDDLREEIKNKAYEKVLRDFNTRDHIKSMLVTADL